MTKKIFNLYFFLFTALCLTKTNATSINYQILEPTVNNFYSRIVSGEVITSDSVIGNLDFIPYDAKISQCDQEKFQALIAQMAPTIQTAFQKLGHNRFNTFVSDCQELFNKDELNNKDRFALVTLLSSIKHKMDCFLKEINTEIDEESIIPDEQFSFLFDSDQDRSRSNSAQSSTSTQCTLNSELTSDHSERQSISSEQQEDIVFSCINLDGRALQPSSVIYYQKKLTPSELPICITCNLQTIKMDMLQSLMEAIQSVNTTKNVREIIFTNGSSVKFNQLFSFLKALSQERTAEKTITIIYSTTSESQKAYKKLSTLRHVIRTSPHLSDENTETMKKESIHHAQRFLVSFSDESMKTINNILK